MSNSAKAFFISFSIPTMILLVFLALLFPGEPRFKSKQDCLIYANNKAVNLCNSLKKESKTEYFNYDKCYAENYYIYLRSALEEFNNPPQLKSDIFSKITYSPLGLPVWICVVIGAILTLVRFMSGDKKWYWFLPEEGWHVYYRP